MLSLGILSFYYFIHATLPLITASPLIPHFYYSYFLILTAFLTTYTTSARLKKTLHLPASLFG
jgi:hypothetical protein